MDDERWHTRQLMQAAYQQADDAGLPIETLISYPVPMMREGRLLAVFFASFVAPTADGTNFEVYQPAARFEIGWADGSPRGSARLEVVPPGEAQPVGLSRPPEFAGPRYGEEEERCAEVEEELLSLLDAVAPLFERGSDDAGVRVRCLATFRRLVPEAMRPLYEGSNPDFFRWLEEGPSPTQVMSAGPVPPVQQEWSPTHVVPQEGMAAWGAPDPQGPVVADLDPGLPLKVLEELSEWAHVEAANGWVGWVDRRLLQEVSR